MYLKALMVNYKVVVVWWGWGGVVYYVFERDLVYNNIYSYTILLPPINSHPIKAQQY